MSHCILLNADYSFLNLVNWKRALCLMAKGKVEVVKDSRATVLSAAGKIFRVPAVLRLIKLIRTIYRAGVAFTKRNVLVRDGFRCAYCGSPSATLKKAGAPPARRGCICGSKPTSPPSRNFCD
jgi:5-methylcytosine-specific restriction endonuclease McrA